MIQAVAALILAAVFAWSGISKLSSLSRADRTITAIRVAVAAPRVVVAAVSLAEIAVALALVLGGDVVREIAGWSALALVGMFTVLLVRAWRLGAREDCGCFGSTLPQRIGWTLFARNGALIGIALVTICSPESSLAFVVLVGFVALGAFAMARASAPEPQAPLETRSAVLVSESVGIAIDPFQEAYAGRDQLLLFVKPGCSSCVQAVAHLDARRAELAPTADVRIVRGIGHRTVIADAASAFGVGRDDVWLDPGALLAASLGIRSRPTLVRLARGTAAPEPGVVGLADIAAAT